jgi:predicted RNase H-like HicB family nuclease
MAWLFPLQKTFHRRRRLASQATAGYSISMIQRTFSAILHREEELYVAECPEVGTVSQGPSIEEALANLKEATELYLEEFPLPAGERPLLTTF